MEMIQKVPGELRVLSNHIYEYKKGVRNLVLYTFSKKYEKDIIKKLENQQIAYIRQDVNSRTINLFFGKPECLDLIRFIANRPLNTLSPEEDFMLGALLGYDLCKQCERYCSLKKKMPKLALRVS